MTTACIITGIILVTLFLWAMLMRGAERYSPEGDDDPQAPNPQAQQADASRLCCGESLGVNERKAGDA